MTPTKIDLIIWFILGWWRIENLEEYTGLRCLWLESNGLRKLENLEAQTNMRCLYIQQNLIEKIENLQHCKMLAVLNLESNRIKKLENLDCLEHLGKGRQQHCMQSITVQHKDRTLVQFRNNHPHGQFPSGYCRIGRHCPISSPITRSKVKWLS